ncbi:MAG: hypothetical protein WDZ80_06630 [Candidatus Paceibacterota bacterium]
MEQYRPSHGKFRAFFGQGVSFDQVANNVKNKIESELSSETEDYILNVDRGEYIKTLKEKHSFDDFVLHFNDITADNNEMMIPGKIFPRGRFMVEESRSYPKTLWSYFIPVSGETELLKIRPSTWASYQPYIYLEGENLCFDVIQFYDELDSVKKEQQETVSYLEKAYERMRHDIDALNKELDSFIPDIFDKRKERLLQTKKEALNIGIPLRKKEGGIKSYSIDNPLKRKIVREKPQVETDVPDPTLSSQAFDAILEIVSSVGKGFEKYPSTYKNKDEEELRDHIVVVLQTHTNDSVSAETFNKKGKTDICIKHSGENVFIAECKFWSGPKSLQSTIDQIEDYLTVRDSKAAIIFFSRNKDFTNVIKTIDAHIDDSDFFIKKIREIETGWSRYEFLLKGDEEGELVLDILVFDLSF